MKRDLLIFTENIEPEAVNQIYTLINQAPFLGQKVRIMPDVHYGKGCVVGFTSTMQDKIIPNVLGEYILKRVKHLYLYVAYIEALSRMHSDNIKPLGLFKHLIKSARRN